LAPLGYGREALAYRGPIRCRVGREAGVKYTVRLESGGPQAKWLCTMLGRFRQNKIRNPNVEIRNNDQCSKSECPQRDGELQDFPAIGTQFGECVFRIRIWGFEFVSDFVFRASDLNARCAPGSCKAS
jgi:hypothetical protein